MLQTPSNRNIPEQVYVVAVAAVILRYMRQDEGNSLVHSGEKHGG